MNCDDCRDMVLDLLYAELGPAKKRELEDHLASCPDCAREYKEFSRTLSAVRSLPDPEVPARLNTRVIAHAQESARKSARPSTAWSRLMRPAMAMAALAVITASVAIVMRERGALKTGAAPGIMAESGKLQAAPPSSAPGAAPLAALGYLEKDKERRRELPEAPPPEAPPEAQPAAPAEPAPALPPAPFETPPEQPPAANEEVLGKSLAEAETPESGATAPVKSPDLDALALADLKKQAGAEAGPASTAAGMPGGAGAAEKSEAPLSSHASAPATRSVLSVNALSAEMPKQAQAKPSPPARPDPKALVRQAQDLEAQKDYRQALALYEQALALMGYNPAETASRDEAAPAGREVKKTPACSPELKAALDGAARLYRRLAKLGDLYGLQQWRKSHCP